MAFGLNDDGDDYDGSKRRKKIMIMAVLGAIVLVAAGGVGIWRSRSGGASTGTGEQTTTEETGGGATSSTVSLKSRTPTNNRTSNTTTTRAPSNTRTTRRNTNSTTTTASKLGVEIEPLILVEQDELLDMPSFPVVVSDDLKRQVDVKFSANPEGTAQTKMQIQADATRKYEDGLNSHEKTMAAVNNCLADLYSDPSHPLVK